MEKIRWMHYMHTVGDEKVGFDPSVEVYEGSYKGVKVWIEPDRNMRFLPIVTSGGSRYCVGAELTFGEAEAKIIDAIDSGLENIR